MMKAGIETFCTFTGGKRVLIEVKQCKKSGGLFGGLKKFTG